MWVAEGHPSSRVQILCRARKTQGRRPPPRRVLVLASRSPRRAALLERAGFRFRVRAANVNETPDPALAPEEAVVDLARRKAHASHAVAPRGLSEWILAADTMGILDDRLIGKPTDAADAVQILSALSGRMHRVVTGLAVLAPSGRTLTAIESTTVTFRTLSSNQVRAYVATGEPFDKACAYAVQGRGAELIERIEGDVTNVIGLPVHRTRELLAECGLRADFSSDPAAAR